MLSAPVKGMEGAAALLLLLSVSHLLYWAFVESLSEVFGMQIRIDRCRMEAEKVVGVLKPGCSWRGTTLPGDRHSRSPSSLGWKQVCA
jgi:hypothetical protein